MQRRRFLSHALLGLTGARYPAANDGGHSPARPLTPRPRKIDKVVKTDGRVAQDPHAGTIQRASEGGHRAAVHEPA